MYEQGRSLRRIRQKSWGEEGRERKIEDGKKGKKIPVLKIYVTWEYMYQEVLLLGVKVKNNNTILKANKIGTYK